MPQQNHLQRQLDAAEGALATLTRPQLEHLAATARLGRAVDQATKARPLPRRTPTRTILARTRAALSRMAADEPPSDWTNPGSHSGYVAALLTATVHAPHPRSVVAEIRGPDAGIWGHLAADALDRAVADLPEVVATATITSLTSARWQLTW